MLTEFNKINRETDEGKLLFAALIELTTRLHTHSTPDQVVEKLWNIHQQTEQRDIQKEPNPNGKMKGAECSVVKKSELAEAIEHANSVTELNKSSKLARIMRGGNDLLEYSIMLGKEFHERLLNDIVAIYRINQQ